MAEHVVKYPVDADVTEQVLALFGKVSNAQRLLRVEHIPYSDMYAALKGNPIKGKYADDIVAAWRFWKQLYLRGLKCGGSNEVNATDFRLPEDDAAVLRRLDELQALENTEWARRVKLTKRAKKK